jgi:hypothetical protein
MVPKIRCFRGNVKSVLHQWALLSACDYAQPLIRNDGVGSSNLSCGTNFHSRWSLIESARLRAAERVYMTHSLRYYPRQHTPPFEVGQFGSCKKEHLSL